MLWWIWIAIGLALLILELFLPSGFFIFFFGVGALLTGILVALIEGLDASWQWIFYSFASVSLALLFRRFLMGQWISQSSFSSTPEGREVLVVDDVLPSKDGNCEYRGSRWAIRNIGSESLAKGDKAIVEKREGFTLLVRKI